MGELLENAISLAMRAHSKQVRKVTKTPYILHPMEVAVIIATMVNDEEVIAAGLLHDTVEDCGISSETIGNLFGSYVQALVASETENKHPEMPEEDSWQMRKEETIEGLRNTDDINMRILWLADKLSNLRSLFQGRLLQGDRIWDSFHQKDPKKHEWYYTEISKCMQGLEKSAAYLEYVQLLRGVFVVPVEKLREEHMDRLVIIDNGQNNSYFN